MTLLKQNNILFLLRSILVALIGITSYFLIITFYTEKQQNLTIDAGDKAMLYARDLIDSEGTISEINGEIFAGNTLLNYSTFIVNRVEAITGFGCTIFHKDTRISTTAFAKDSDEIAIGTQSNAEIADKVYMNGETFKGVTTTIGKEWLTIYEPLYSFDGERIGMLAVFREHESFLADQSDFNWIVALVILAFITFVLILLWRSFNSKQKLHMMQLEAKENFQELIAKNQELEKLILVVEEVEHAIAIINKDDRIEWVNKSFEKSLQYNTKEAVGRKVSAILGGPETDRTVVRKMDEAIFINKRPISTTVLQYRKDNSFYWARVHLTPFLDEAGELERYIAISLDISKEKKTIDQLQKSEANIRQIGETIDDVVYLYSINSHHYEYISPKCRAVLGANPDFFYSGQNHVDLFVHYEDRPNVVAARHRIKDGQPYDIEYRLNIDGEIRWIRERAFPIQNDKGEVIKNSGICQDITSQKKMQEQINRSRNNLKHLLDITRAINTTSTIEELIKKTQRRLAEVMDVHIFSIGIIDPISNNLRFPVFIESRASYYNVTHSLDENILTTKCVKEGQEILFNNTIKELDASNDIDPTDGDNPLSVIYLPLYYRNEIIGVITTQSLKANAYDTDQIELLKGLSIYIASAITNLQALGAPH